MKIMIQMFVNETKLPLPYTGYTNSCKNQGRNTASWFFIRSSKSYPLLSSSLNGCVSRDPLTVSGVVVRWTKNKNNPTCLAHHTTDTWSDHMTGADNTVSNVKMHSSQRKGHQIKTRSQQTRLLIHVHHKQIVFILNSKKKIKIHPLQTRCGTARTSVALALTDTKTTVIKQARRKQRCWRQRRGGMERERRGGEGGGGHRTMRVLTDG